MSEREREKGNESVSERKTRSEIEKKTKKMHMNEENLKESSERRRLPIKR